MTRIGTSIIPFVVSCFVFHASVAAAQTKISPLVGSEVTSSQIAGRFPNGSRARIVVHGERIIAWNASVVSDSIAAMVHGKPASIPLSEIDTIWVKTGTRAIPIAWAVGIPFAAAGALLGAGLSCIEAPCRDTRGAATAFGIVFGAIGAGAGATLGSIITHWTLIFVRPQSSG